MRVRITSPELLGELVESLASWPDAAVQPVSHEELDVSLLGSFDEDAMRMELYLRLRTWQAADSKLLRRAAPRSRRLHLPARGRGLGQSQLRGAGALSYRGPSRSMRAAPRSVSLLVSADDVRNHARPPLVATHRRPPASPACLSFASARHLR